MTKKEFNTLMKIMGDSCHGYEIAMAALSKSSDYKSKSDIEKHKAYLSEIVRLDLQWRNEVQKVLWKTTHGKNLAQQQDENIKKENNYDAD